MLCISSLNPTTCLETHVRRHDRRERLVLVSVEASDSPVRGVRNGWKSRLYAYGQKSIEISWKSGEISQKWKSEIKFPLHALLLIAPFTIVNYKAACCGARTRESFRPRRAGVLCIMGLWRMTTSKGNSSFGSVQL